MEKGIIESITAWNGGNMEKGYAGKEIQKYNRQYREFDEFYHSLAAASGLSESAFWILYVICDQGEGCLQRDICRAVCVSKQTIHSAIRKLEDEGYLYMKSGHGRDKHIFLTERGSVLAEEKIRPVMEMENAAFDVLGETESRRLLELTEQYFQALVKQTEKAGQYGRKEGKRSE